MYSIAGFGEMIADSVRMDAYARALRQSVRPGSAVLDIGTGTGILAMIACQCGAARVYAIDPSDAVQIALDAVRDNGFSDRVVVIQKRSADLTLPERVETIVSDIRGILPPLGRNLLDLVDARERFLSSGGRLVPRSDSLWASLAEFPDRHAKILSPWLGDRFGLNLRSGARYVQNTWVKVRASASELLAPPSKWAELDYASLAAPRVHGGGELRVSRTGVAHGLVLWFDTELAEGIGFSNAPGGPELIYGQAFFPWPESVAVREGDVVGYQVRADLVGSEYVWTWDSTLRRGAGATGADVRFRQSTFLGAPFTKETLARRSPSRSPGLGQEGLIARTSLDRMRAGASLDELAQELHREHPDRFRSRQEALDFASDLSSRYGR